MFINVWVFVAIACFRRRKKWRQRSLIYVIRIPKSIVIRQLNIADKPRAVQLCHV